MASKNASIAPVIIEKLFSDTRSAVLCAGIYQSSWQTTAVRDYTENQIVERLTSRTLGYWEDYIRLSSLALFGINSFGRGFCLVTPTRTGTELSYIFVEPEAFGTGLADELCNQAELASGRPLEAWVLPSNVRSQKFFSGRGWKASGDAEQPNWNSSNIKFQKFVLEGVKIGRLCEWDD